MASVTLAADWAAALGAVATLGGVVATLCAGWWTWRAAVPHRKATYSVEITPLLSSTHSGLSVSLGVDQLAHPHTVTLKVTNTGNREIVASSFNGEPIEFQMGARVVSVLSKDTTGNRRVPPTSIHGNALHIDPYVLHKKQQVTYKLLIDGPAPELKIRHSLSASLKPDNTQAMRSARYLAMTVGAGIAAAMISIWITPLLGDYERTAEQDFIENVRKEAYQDARRDLEKELKEKGAAGVSATPSPSAPATR
ncbi:hypothetical protein ACWDY7_05750 [Streptomyces calvus]|uniref:Uncharacterized protein n=1 Tax=Streptomyces calvus TaxID=67282 RepID=A0AA40SBJ1_9ACTN|nr:hypothetical protein [Streptomyces calvus]MBA8943497.1 hypothetical protein [Streptomyces calvus]GGP39161.1 hypothetical protein GCM10010247_09230 [Streptomyces calvus]